MQKLLRPQTGSIAVILLAVIVLILAGAVGWGVMRRVNTEPNTKQTAQNTTDDTDTAEEEDTTTDEPTLTSLQRNALNTELKNDALTLATAVAEYVNNNSGSMPTDYTDGKLSGLSGDYPMSVDLKQYSNVLVTTDLAETTLTADTLIVVSRAVCNEAKTAAAEGTSSRQYVILYALKAADGGLDPICLET